MGGPYRWSIDRYVRWSVDPVRWTGPRTGGQCFRVTQVFLAQFSGMSSVIFFIVFKPGTKNGENIKPTKITRKEKIDNSNP